MLYFIGFIFYSFKNLTFSTPSIISTAERSKKKETEKKSLLFPICLPKAVGHCKAAFFTSFIVYSLSGVLLPPDGGAVQLYHTGSGSSQRVIPGLVGCLSGHDSDVKCIFFPALQPQRRHTILPVLSPTSPLAFLASITFCSSLVGLLRLGQLRQAFSRRSSTSSSTMEKPVLLQAHNALVAFLISSRLVFSTISGLLSGFSCFSAWMRGGMFSR